MAYSSVGATWCTYPKKVEHMSVVYKHVVSTLGPTCKAYINY